MKDNPEHETQDAVQPDEQSNLTADTLLCGECAHRTDAARLDRTGEETIGGTDVEHFECPECGATGTVECDQKTAHVARYGCVTTPRLIDLERESAWARANGGGY